MLKAVGNSDWAFDMETLIKTYNACVKPAFSYNPAIWVPNTNPSNICKIQMVQNKCLRVITGCHLSTAEDHLHNETSILPVAIRLDILCTQFLASAMRCDHPSHDLVNLPHGPRLMKHTLSSRYLPSLTLDLNDDSVIPEP
jgi:hypothetical protein